MDLNLLLAKTWNDIQPTNCKNIYFYSHQQHFNHNMFSQLKNMQPNINIFILDSKPGLSGYIGYEKTHDILINDYNISDKNIKPVPFLYNIEGMVNTYNESKSLAVFLEANKLSEIIIGSPIFHLPRALISLVSSINNYKFKIYCNRCGDFSDWDKRRFVHSQGVLRGTICELFRYEMNKITEYHIKGDLLSIKHILEYLNNRDIK